ncbi:MAG: hypothetical protein IJV75_03885 [Alphaproteobacteria bacterium]|nr:hypothetical protein [Alphaproteobacteria bacterium]
MEVAAITAVATTAASVFYSKKAADAQKKQIKASNAAAQKQYELEKQQINLTLKDEQRKNRSLLAQQQSAYKAKLGAVGLDESGSAGVVLDTMKKEHDAEDKYLTSSANISLEALQNSIDETRTRNLLSLSQHAATTTAGYFNSATDMANGLGRTLLK